MVEPNTLISDSVIFIRNLLLNNLTDPIAYKRNSSSKFVLTSFPKRKVEYPIITIKSMDLVATKLGMGTDNQLANMEMEARIWARNVAERDELTQQVFNILREKQFITDGSSENELHDLRILSMVDIDEDAGEQSIRSKVITFRYMFIVT